MSIHSYIRRERPPNSCNVNARHWLSAHVKHFLSNLMLNGSIKVSCFYMVVYAISGHYVSLDPHIQSRLVAGLTPTDRHAGKHSLV